MKKRIISALLLLVLLIGILPGTVLASSGLSNFVKVAAYKSGRFSDVQTSKWYAPYVQAAYEYGLISGKPAGLFDPGAAMTVAEAIKLASCLHSVYYTGSASFSAGSPWYKPYVDYAVANGILSADVTNYTASITRSEFAALLSKALPPEAIASRNDVEDNAIPDVPLGYSYSPAVYMLYRAGVLAGCDKAGHFYPNDTITRAEVAAIVVRLANAAYRVRVTLGLDLTQEQIFEKCSPAVFYIEIYDIKDKAIKTGSGFFIASDGMAVTNYHVIQGAAKAVVTLADGTQRNVTGIYDYSKEKDLALIKVEGSNFPYLETADADKIVTGANVYAIGSPLGYKNSFSAGLVSSASRDVEGNNYIQTTAAISPGSSGGALIDQTGRVVGVTTATAVNGQNINLAVPINRILDFDKSTLVTLQSILPNTTYYDGHYPMPDFGAYAKTPIYQIETVGSAAIYYYRMTDLSMQLEDAFEGYADLLTQNTFSFYGYAVEDGQIISYYLNSAYGMLVTFGIKEYNGVECIRIQIL